MELVRRNAQSGLPLLRSCSPEPPRGSSAVHSGSLQSSSSPSQVLLGSKLWFCGG